jgi:hypothetical protein
VDDVTPEELAEPGFTERVPGSLEDRRLNEQGIYLPTDPRHPDYALIKEMYLDRKPE